MTEKWRLTAVGQNSCMWTWGAQVERRGDREFLQGLEGKAFRVLSSSQWQRVWKRGEETRAIGLVGKVITERDANKKQSRSVSLSSARLTTPDHLSVLHKYYIHNAVWHFRFVLFIEQISHLIMNVCCGLEQCCRCNCQNEFGSPLRGII